MNDGLVPPNDAGPPSGGAVDWLRRELADDGEGKVLPTLGRGIGLLATVALGVFVAGAVAAALSVVAFGDQTGPLVVMLVLCLPALIAPLVVRRNLVRLREAVTHPREAAGQLRDLLSGVTDSPELRELVGRARATTPSGPVTAPRRGRIRRTFRSARLISAVVGSAEPDPDRHALLLPFTPERTARTFAAFTWSTWGLLLAFVVAATAIGAIVVDAL